MANQKRGRERSPDSQIYSTKIRLSNPIIRSSAHHSTKIRYSEPNLPLSSGPIPRYQPEYSTRIDEGPDPKYPLRPLSLCPEYVYGYGLVVKGRSQTDVMLSSTIGVICGTRHRMRRDTKGMDGNGAVVKGVPRGEEGGG